MKPLYEALSREAIVSVKAPQVMHFLGKKMSPQLAQEVGSRLSTRIEGTCIKHRLGKHSVKMYDKFGRVLRIETTTNDASFFNLLKAVDHGGHGEKRGKTGRWVKSSFHPQGDRIIFHKLLFLLCVLRGSLPFPG